jgi:carboxymethylenebutenolidase
MSAQPQFDEPRHIDQRVYDLYDELLPRPHRSARVPRACERLVIGGVSALAMAQALFPRYADAQTIMFTDERITAKYVEYPSPAAARQDARLPRAAERGRVSFRQCS